MGSVRASPALRVVIDAHMLGEGEGGNETYVAGLLQGLGGLGPSSGASIAALVGPRGDRVLDPLLPIERYTLGRWGDAWRLFAEVPRSCRRLKADVVHATYNAAPWLPCPLVLAVHDVLFRDYPELFSPRVRLLLLALLSMSMRRASVILTLSEASRDDIARYYPFAREKTLAIPLAPGPVVKATPALDSIPEFVRGRPFILAVGRIQPRKNLSRLIEAYIRLREQNAIDAALLLVGKPEWRYEKIRAIVGGTEYAKDIRFMGYVDDPCLAALYRRCSVFVFPSLAEGFGLPVLEAMACGAPVITSNLSSLPEVAGDAALLVNPYSVEDIAQAIENVLTDPALQDELRQRGEYQAARFSWERTAELTLGAYRRAAKEAVY